jgi:hypothetical protein
MRIKQYENGFWSRLPSWDANITFVFHEIVDLRLMKWGISLPFILVRIPPWRQSGWGRIWILNLLVDDMMGS